MTFHMSEKLSALGGGESCDGVIICSFMYASCGWSIMPRRLVNVAKNFLEKDWLSLRQIRPSSPESIERKNSYT